MGLDQFQNLICAQYLENEWAELAHFCLSIDIDKIKVDIDMHDFCKLAAELSPLFDFDWNFMYIWPFYSLKCAVAGPSQTL